MRWLRSSHDETYEAAVDEVARTLEAAAGEAPDSPRMTEIRAAVLEKAATPRPMVFVPAMAMAAVLVLAVVGAVTVGLPAVGSYLDGLRDGPPPVSTEPGVDEESKELRTVDQKGTVEEVVGSASPSTGPVEVIEPPVSSAPSPTPTEEVSPPVSPTPTPEPTEPPGILPTPPIPIPTPPIIPAP